MDAFLPGGQLERPLSWLGRARLPAHLRVLTATTPAAVLSPPRATRIRSRTACNRRAAPLPSIVGAGIEDPCAICPEICGVTRLEPYVATRRGGGRLAEGSSSHISWCVHCIVWFLYLRRCRSRGHAVQGATRSGRTERRHGNDVEVKEKVRWVEGGEETWEPVRAVTDCEAYGRYSLGAPLRNPCVKKRGPDLARRQAKKNTEPRRV